MLRPPVLVPLPLFSLFVAPPERQGIAPPAPCRFGFSFQDSYLQWLEQDFGLKDIVEKAQPVKLMLSTRCHMNQLIFDNLVKNVGLESRNSTGGAVTVINANSVAANPTNGVKTAVEASAGALASAKVDKPSLPWWAAPVAFVGLNILTRGRLLGLFGLGRRNRNRHGNDSDGSYNHARSGGSGRRRGSSSPFSDSTRMMAISAECISDLNSELQKAR